MNYKGFTICYFCGSWRCKIEPDVEYLAKSKEDAMAQVDEYIRRFGGKIWQQ